MLTAGLTAVPAALVAVSSELGHQYSDRKIVINESLSQDEKARAVVCEWAKANGMDPEQWGLPITVNIDQKTITGPYHPEKWEPFEYERTIPMTVPLPESLIGKD
jgi:hypothetical protein